MMITYHNHTEAIAISVNVTCICIHIPTHVNIMAACARFLSKNGFRCNCSLACVTTDTAVVYLIYYYMCAQ